MPTFRVQLNETAKKKNPQKKAQSAAPLVFGGSSMQKSRVKFVYLSFHSVCEKSHQEKTQ